MWAWHCIRNQTQEVYLPSNAKKFGKIMKLPMNVATDGHRAFYRLWQVKREEKQKQGDKYDNKDGHNNLKCRQTSKLNFHSNFKN